jgi:hypothetical protein
MIYAVSFLHQNIIKHVREIYLTILYIVTNKNISYLLKNKPNARSSS